MYKICRIYKKAQIIGNLSLKTLENIWEIFKEVLGWWSLFTVYSGKTRNVQCQQNVPRFPKFSLNGKINWWTLFWRSMAHSLKRNWGVSKSTLLCRWSIILVQRGWIFSPFINYRCVLGVTCDVPGKEARTQNAEYNQQSLFTKSINRKSVRPVRWNKVTTKILAKSNNRKCKLKITS